MGRFMTQKKLSLQRKFKALLNFKCRPRCFLGVCRIQIVFDDNSIEYRFANASSLCKILNLEMIKRGIEYFLIIFLGKNISSSEERYKIDSNNLSEEKIREIVSDSIDYYLGKYIKSSIIFNHENNT